MVLQLKTAPFAILGAFVTLIVASIIPALRGADMEQNGAGPFTKVSTTAPFLGALCFTGTCFRVLVVAYGIAHMRMVCCWNDYAMPWKCTVYLDAVNFPFPAFSFPDYNDSLHLTPTLLLQQAEVINGRVAMVAFALLVSATPPSSACTAPMHTSTCCAALTGILK